MTAGRCRPLKIETVAEGGPADMQATETNPHTDGLDAASFFLQASTTADSTCYLDRDPADGGMRVTDAIEGTRRIPDLVSRTLSASASHQALIDIMHFLDDGPGDGWASGAYRVRQGVAPNPGGWIWYTSSAMTKRIISVTYTYPVGSILPSSKQWLLYASDGATVARTLTDAMTWSGALLTNTTRTWS